MAGWVLGFAVEAPTIPFTFDYVTTADRENMIDLNLVPGAYGLNSAQAAFAFYGEKVDNSFGVVIDPCKYTRLIF